MAGKGKKGGKGKAIEMTEEERQHMLQQKALAEEEMLRKKQAMAHKQLTEQLQEEERNTEVNENKLVNKWRPIFRRMRASELRNDVTMLSQSFERVLDHKDCVIKCLEDELNKTREKSAQTHRSHLNCIDRLLTMQSERLVALEQRWCRELEELCTDFTTEREILIAQHQQECMYLEDVDFAIEQCHNEVDADTRQDFLSTRNDIKNRNTEEKNALRVQLEGEAEELWHQIQQAVQDYAEATKYRSKTFDSLVSRDEYSALEMESQMKKIQKLQHSIAMLRNRLSSAQKKDEEEAEGLRTIREEVTALARQVNAQMTSNLSRDRCHLTNLTIYSNGAAKKLQSIVDKGKKLLRVTEMCRRMETEEEKSLRFYCHSPNSSDSAEQIPESCQDVALTVTLPFASTRSPPAPGQDVLDYTGLESVWHRYNKVLLERLCLAKEQVALNQENERLRGLLRQYLEGISVSDEVLRQRNTLLVVSRPPVHKPEPVQYPRSATGGQHAFMNVSMLPSLQMMHHGL
ncbi:dynein regulatory complex subunit 2-like [Megalops cyprinoides]|uniref:dynein regulatory complex subunit 2-like n=1 Tax=Megalops cyprinoides TaxID=118141 RepID=UPI0018650F4F|nr:dynein regulatory complex subunit 2-like [Megalops cyprinoides]